MPSTRFARNHQPPGGTKNRRLNRGDMAPYRARFIAGVELRELAPDLQAEFDYDTEEHALQALKRRQVADGWVFARQAYRERTAEEVLARRREDQVQSFLEILSSDGDYILRSGVESLRMLTPATVTEALDMIRTGTQLGLRGRNLPERVTLSDLRQLLTPVEPAVVAAAQQLPAGTYEALAFSCDAEFAELPAGRAAAVGRD